MKPQFVWFGILSVCITILFGISGCKSSTPATEAEYGPMVVPAPSGPSCDPNPCLEEGEGKDKCVLTPLGTSCECNDFHTAEGEGCVYAGEQAEVVSPSADLDLDSEDLTYTSRVVVVDDDNLPILETTLQLGNLLYQLNSENEFVIGEVPFYEQSRAIIRAPGYATLTKRVSWRNSGRQKLILRPLLIENVSTFDAGSGQAIDAENVALQVTAGTFIRNLGAEGLKSYKGAITVRTASLDPEDENADSAPGEMMGVDRGSSEVALVSGGMVSVDVTDDDGNALEIRDGRSVTVDFHLPADFEANAGDQMPLWYFDEDMNRWLEEGSCAVQSVTSEARMERRPDRKLECVGQVKHFSWWNVAKPVEVHCTNHWLYIDVPPGYQIVGFNAEPWNNPNWASTYVDFMPPDETSYEASFCARFGESRLAGAELPAGNITLQIALMRLTDSAVGTFKYEASVLPEEFLPSVSVSQGLNDCRKAPVCFQKTIIVAANAFLGADGHLKPAVEDLDYDGYYTAGFSGGDEPECPECDCDDKNFRMNPGAVDIPCNDVDEDCDGTLNLPVPASGAYTYTEFGSEASGNPAIWNTNCQYSCFEKTDEVGGNDLDEDCDSVVGDEDGDGFTAAEGDCNDQDSSSHPGPDNPEVWGNEVDEDCDGYIGDVDDDGKATKDYCGAASDGAARWQDCGDCNDHNAAIFEGADRSESILNDPQFYECAQEDADENCVKFTRTQQFCDYFGSAEAIENNGDLLKRDYNCDGLVSDLDGDGFTLPGDQTKGAEYAWDCDDLDPRVRPAGPSATQPTCGLIDDLNGGNESECEADATSLYFKPDDESADSGAKCELIEDYQPICVDLNDQEGNFSGIFVCSPGPKGVYTQPPNPYGFIKKPLDPANSAYADGKVYAQAWAPCDGLQGQGALPGCDKYPDCVDILDPNGTPTGEKKCGQPLICISGFTLDTAYLEGLHEWAAAGQDLDGDGENDLPGSHEGCETPQDCPMTDFAGRTVYAGSFDVTDLTNHSLCAPSCGDLCTKNPCTEAERSSCALSTQPPAAAVCSCSVGLTGEDCSECATGFHDGGDGTCVLDGTCVVGYHDGGEGACVAD